MAQVSWFKTGACSGGRYSGRLSSRQETVRLMWVQGTTRDDVPLQGSIKVDPQGFAIMYRLVDVVATCGL